MKVEPIKYRVFLLNINDTPVFLDLVLDLQSIKNLIQKIQIGKQTGMISIYYKNQFKRAYNFKNGEIYYIEKG